MNGLVNDKMEILVFSATYNIWQIFLLFFLFRKLITSNLIRTPRRTHARTMNQVRVEETRRRSRRERLPFIKLKSDRPIHTPRESEEEKGNEIIPELGWSRWMNWLRSNEGGGGGDNTCNRALKYGHLPMAPGLITSVFSEAGPGTVMY